VKHRRYIPTRRGFATVAALMMVIIVGLATTVMLSRLKWETDMARDTIAGVELRQMLNAGALASPRLALDRRPDPTGQRPPRPDVMFLELPESLRQRDGSVKLTVRRDRRNLEKRIIVEARLDGRAAWQTLRYIRGETGWGLAEATLERPSSSAD